MPENVNHPDHYQNIAGVEAIDILNDVVKGLDAVPACMLWNCMKYLLRFKDKNGLEDLKKAQNYLNWLIESLEEPADYEDNTDNMDYKKYFYVFLKTDKEFSKYLCSDAKRPFETVEILTDYFKEYSEFPTTIDYIAALIGAEELIADNGIRTIAKPDSISIVYGKDDQAKLKFGYLRKYKGGK